MAMEMLEMEMVGATSPCGSAATAAAASDDEADLKRGPWTVEEDVLLVNHIAAHGEGRWNSLAQSAGLKRTGKSCRLRWLNYLRPDVRRGNITEEEQLLILELHSRWGNRWSKIAQHLPGRTDNEIKNYWRTRVQKHAKQLKCDVNSKQFRDVMRYLWMPRLVERIQADSAAAAAAAVESPVVVNSPIAGGLRPPPITVYQTGTCNAPSQATTSMSPDASSVFGSSSSSESSVEPQFTSNPVISDGVAGWSSSMQCGVTSTLGDNDVIHDDILSGSWSELLAAADGSGFTGCFTGLPDLELGEFGDNLWSLEDILLQC